MVPRPAVSVAHAKTRTESFDYTFHNQIAASRVLLSSINSANRSIETNDLVSRGMGYNLVRIPEEGHVSLR